MKVKVKLTEHSIRIMKQAYDIDELVIFKKYFIGYGWFQFEEKEFRDIFVTHLYLDCIPVYEGEVEFV